MSDLSTNSVNTQRISLVIIGALAGLSFWLLFDVLYKEFDNGRALFCVSAFLGAFFGGLLGVAGVLTLRRAILAGLIVSIIPTILLFWASFRFETVEGIFKTGSPIIAFFILVCIPLPFIIAAFDPEKSWRDYDALFHNAWGIFARIMVAWVFVGLFWGLVVLSNALLQVVGLDIIEDLLKIDVVPYLLTGATLGLAISVVHEMSETLSPYLLLRLLRLLLPVVLVVVAIFVVAVPFNGLSGLFGNLSAALILMAMAIASVTLVTSAIDCENDQAVDTAFMQNTTRAMALLLPILSGLAVYAIVVRVVQYGWSPTRMEAALVSGFTFAYAVIYAVSALNSAHWMAKIRAANVVLALALIVVSALWLSPLLNIQRISANSQLARYASGKTSIEDLDLWEISRDWGIAGRDILPKFATARPETADEMEKKIAAVKRSGSKWQYNQPKRDGQKTADMNEFLELVPVLPAGSEMPKGLFNEANWQSDWLEGCKRKTDAGRPACLVILGNFLPDVAGEEAMFAVSIWNNDILIDTWSAPSSNNGAWNAHDGALRFRHSTFGQTDLDVLDLLYEGKFSIAPPRVNALSVGGWEFIMTP